MLLWTCLSQILPQFSLQQLSWLLLGFSRLGLRRTRLYQAVGDYASRDHRHGLDGETGPALLWCFARLHLYHESLVEDVLSSIPPFLGVTSPPSPSEVACALPLESLSQLAWGLGTLQSPAPEGVLPAVASAAVSPIVSCLSAPATGDPLHKKGLTDAVSLCFGLAALGAAAQGQPTEGSALLGQKEAAALGALVAGLDAKKHLDLLPDGSVVELHQLLAWLRAETPGAVGGVKVSEELWSAVSGRFTELEEEFFDVRGTTPSHAR